MTFDANDIKARAEQIENLVALFNTEQASKELLQLVRDFAPDKKNDAILISSKFYQWKKVQRQGTMSPEQTNVLINQCQAGILDLLDEVIFVLQ